MGFLSFAIVDNWTVGGVYSAMPDETAEVGHDLVEMCLHHGNIPIIWLTRDTAQKLAEALSRHAEGEPCYGCGSDLRRCKCDIPF